MKGRAKIGSHLPDAGAKAAGAFPLFCFRDISFSFAFLFPTRFILSDDLKSLI